MHPSYAGIIGERLVGALGWNHRFSAGIYEGGAE
jgi:hypothetical protein